MKILEYQYQDVGKPGWEFSKVEFNNTNLIVGDTATGKTRILNTIFNLGRFIASNEFKHGDWSISFEHHKIKYLFNLKTERIQSATEPDIIHLENLWRYEKSSLKPIVERNKDSFIFNGKKLPKLPLRETSISLLKSEEVIKPIFEAFTQIMMRRFDSSELDDISKIETLPDNLINSLRKDSDPKELFRANLKLNSNLYLLSEYFSDIFDRLIKQYRQIFPFIRKVKFVDLKELNPNISVGTPISVFCAQERRANDWIPLPELSSGMKKVLLILTDNFILPEHGVYMVDEYENSLGISAIDFFPEFLIEFDKKIQFFITSHHPYLINAIPTSNWYIFHRRGLKVHIIYGSELSEQFGKSKQKAFTQLMNYPYYVNGVK